MIDHMIISGASGTLLVALRAQAWPELKVAASRLADASVDHLMGHATKSGNALTWKSLAFENALAGMAHGSCGIDMALAEYAATRGSLECWSAAKAALKFASQSFDQEAGTWRDLRHESGHMVAWCHGAAGIVLARQRVVELAPLHAEPWIQNEIESGLKTLREQSVPSSDTLCHGRSGNWEPLWRGSVIDRELAERQVSSLCAHLSDNKLPGGDFVTPTPDLMNGWAGIGLQILRSIDPRVADVTTLRT